jgi:tRNA(Ile)-lysidine synthase
MKHVADEFTRALKSLKAGSKLLLAVSGGVDSMVMLYLAREAGLRCGVAHVNYGLRGEESVLDALLVEQTALRLRYPFHLLQLSASESQQLAERNTQEAARTIRYDWLTWIKTLHGYDHILTAHHSDDQAETVLHHFLRGSGPKGLAGIAPRTTDCIRPLLAVSRKDILSWAEEHHVVWREDDSNATTAYTRNKLRHEVLPQLEQHAPGLAERLAGLAPVYQETADLVKRHTQQALHNYLLHEAGITSLDLADFNQYPYPRLLIAEWLMPFGFAFAQADEVLALTASQSGARVESATHTLWKDRDRLCLVPRKAAADTEEFIARETKRCQHFPVICEAMPRNEWVLSTSPDCGQFDLDTLRFPLTARYWREGDRIRPLGMDGTQLVSDILTQRKVPVFMKSSVVVVEMNGEIIWVAGHRIAEQYKVTPSTQAIWQMTIV